MSVAFYFIKFIFLLYSWLILFNFDIENIDVDLLFLSIFIYSGSVMFDLIVIVWKNKSITKKAKLARGLSWLLLIDNIIIVFFSLCFSNLLQIAVLNNEYIFQLRLKSFVHIFNISPNLFTLKRFLMFVLISGLGTIFSEILIEIDETQKIKQRREKKTSS